MGPGPAHPRPGPSAPATKRRAGGAHASIAGQPTRWLFPGGHPGRHRHAGTFGRQLAKLGIMLHPARNAAMIQFAVEIPASVLADILGLTAATAVRWAALAARDWTLYTALRPHARSWAGPHLSGRLSNPQPALCQLDDLGIGTAQDGAPGKAQAEATVPRPSRTARPLKPAQIEKLIAGYRSGRQMKELAAEFGIDQRTVTTHLRRAGVATRRGGLGKTQVVEAARLYEATPNGGDQLTDDEYPGSEQAVLTEELGSVGRGD